MYQIYKATCSARLRLFCVFFTFHFSLFTFHLQAQSDVSVRVTSNSPTYSIYGYITFYVAVKNNGPNAASNVVCIVPQPVGSSNACSKADVGFWRNWDTGVWEIGNLNAGDSTNLQITLFTLTASGITIDAKVTSSSADLVPSNNTASRTATLGASAKRLNCDDSVDNSGGGGNNNNSTDEVNLSIELSASNVELNYGASEYFILKIKNAGPKAATNVKLQLSTPQGLLFKSADIAGLGSFDLATGIWDIGTVDAFNSHTILVQALVVQGGNFKCSAQVTACDQTDSNSKPNNYSGSAVEDDEADINILGLWADLSMKAVLKSGSSQVKLGDNVTFLATLTNSGPTRADGVKIRSYLPQGMQFVSATASIGVYDSHLGVWILSSEPDPNNYGNKPGFTIQANTSQTLEITFKAVQLGAIVYDIEVRSDNVPDPNSTPSNFNLAENDEAQVTINVVNQLDPNPIDTTTVSGGGNFELNISSNTAIYKPNSIDSFRITVKNTGKSNSQNLKISFPFPDNTVTGGASIASTGTWNEWCADGKQCFTWSIPILNANTSATLDLPLYIRNPTGNITATATITSVSPNISASVVLAANLVGSENGVERMIYHSQLSTLNSQLLVFPNPAKNELSVMVMTETPTANIFIYDAFGRIVKTFYNALANVNVIKTSVSEFSAGNYFVRLVVDGKNDVVQRFVVMK